MESQDTNSMGMAEQVVPQQDKISQDILERGPVIERSDFVTEIRENKNASTWMSCFLILIGGGFGYAIGWSLDMFASSYVSGYDPFSGTLKHFLFSKWGIGGCITMLVTSLIWSVIVLVKGDRVLVWMVGAEYVTEENERQLHNVVAEMAIASGLPKPRVVVVEDPALNAFATGLTPENSTIGVTRGLLDTLDRDELQAVVGHEMGHVLNNDVLYATMISVQVGLIAMVADTIKLSFRSSSRTTSRVAYRASSGSGRGKGKGSAAAAIIAIVVLIAVSIIAPLSAKLVQMSISRKREFLADATAVKLTRNPKGLFDALGKISTTKNRFSNANRAIQHMFFVNPFRDFDRNASELFSTHPPLIERIDKLRGML